MAKIGEGHWGAWWRQGLAELRGALYAESNVAQRTEYGMYGTKTQGEVAEDRSDEKSLIEAKLDQTKERADGEERDENRSPERE